MARDPLASLSAARAGAVEHAAVRLSAARTRVELADAEVQALRRAWQQAAERWRAGAASEDAWLGAGLARVSDLEQGAAWHGAQRARIAKLEGSLRAAEQLLEEARSGESGEAAAVRATVGERNALRAGLERAARERAALRETREEEEVVGGVVALRARGRCP